MKEYDEANCIRVTYIFDDDRGEKYDELFDKCFGNKNSRVVFGDFWGIQFEVDCREEES